jgi:hypothetical protein
MDRIRSECIPRPPIDWLSALYSETTCRYINSNRLLVVTCIEMSMYIRMKKTWVPQSCLGIITYGRFNDSVISTRGFLG